MEYTENYNLKKPAQEDFYNVEDFNNNADVIDKELKAVSDKANSALPATSYTSTDILNKLKTVDGANSGLDADLFKGKSVIPVENGGTGANTKVQAFKNLAYQGNYRKAIDFNNLIDSGYYILPANGENGPIADDNDWTLLKVMAGKIDNTYMVEQIATIIQTTDSRVSQKIYQRQCYSDNTNNWTDWIEIIASKSIIPVKNGGTGESTLSNFVSYKGRPEAKSLSEIRETGLYLIYGVDYDDYPTNSGNFAIMTVYQAANYVYQTVYGAFTNNNSIAVNYRFINTNTEVIVGWNENVNAVNLPTLMQAALQSGGVSVIKSIQRGGIIIPEGEFEASATITAVNKDKAVVIYGGTSANYNVATSCIQLLSSTKVTVSRNSASSTSQSYVHYQVIEYY